MRKLYSPENDAELALIKSILDGENVHYFVHNDHFGSLKVGPKIDLFNAKTIMIPDHQYDFAHDIIRDFVSKNESSGLDERQIYLPIDKLRMIVEAILFTWFMPGRKWRKQKSKS